MDDLYGDLENYNEVNSVDELRNENKELKLKLEEYEAAMGKLQKSLLQDYDKLAMEFNNLQKNYSSLLKTARAEVERKTQMITQLNLEKDMMVLKALQNGNNRRFPNKNKFQIANLNPNKSGNANANKTTNQSNVEPSKVGKKAKNLSQQKKIEDKNERCEPSCISTNPTISRSDNAKLLDIVDNIVNNVEACISKGELKENVSLCKPEHKEDARAHRSSINDRRKSFSAAVMPKFSSDEDCGSEKSTNLTRHTEPRKEIHESRNINAILTRISNEQLSNRTSETPSSDGRCSNYQETDKEGYKSRTSRHTDRFRDGDRHSDRYRERDKSRDAEKLRDVDKFREGDKYRESGKFRENDRYRENEKQRESGKYREGDKYRDGDRHRETDKHKVGDKHREADKHKNGDKHRDSDRFRGRDTFDSSLRHRKQLPDRPLKRSFREHQEDHGPDFGRRRLASPPPEPQNFYHQRSHDHRAHYELSHESEKYKNQYEQRYAEKLPIHESHDMPSSSKRQKVDSEVHIDDNRRHDREHPTRPPRNDMNDYDMLHGSCQSPDAVFSPDLNEGVVHPHTVLEIKNTPTIELEDPRVTSNKYVLKDENGKSTLSAAGSKSIQIKPVDKSLWNIESVAVPDALLCEPQSQFDEQNIKEIYMDIDNLEANISVESGEIKSDSEEILSKGNKENVTERDLQTLNVIKPAIEATPVQKPNLDKVPMIASTYRIPKKSQKVLSRVSEATKTLPKIVCEDRPVEKKDFIDSECLINSKSSLPQIEEHDNFVAASNTNVKLQENNKDQITLSEIAMVQDDLELSDETSDNLELQRQLLLEKINYLSNKTKPEIQITLDDQADNSEVLNIEADNKTKGSDKKHKTKRRKTKSKEKDLGETVEDFHVTERKTKSKKEKLSKPKEIKNKFSDLFGDSSSLITPEDLGIPTSCVPLCEDAQDAVDINFKEIVKAPLSYPNEQDAKETCDDNLNNKIHIENAQDTNVNNPNTEDKEIAKRIEEQIASPDVDTNIVYKNLNAEEETNKPDVVKTVIISSGVQPQFVADDMENRKVENRVADVEVNIQNIVECYQPPAAVEFKKLNSMKALATSTPHKDCTVSSTIETDSKTIEHVSNCNDSNSISVDTGRQAADHSDTNTQGSHDAPDVRIFVRRRRKGIKKT